ncbi:MAG: hypothetical protein M3276_00940, partial [Actinomycetota bacterium]|nr:hypothetical protein [Actinomycetota bacterium]
MGKYPNQFIVAPAGHGFLDFVIADISKRLEETDQWDPAQVATLTGPSFFATAIEGYYRTQYGVSNLETPERRHMVEPGALARVV